MGGVHNFCEDGILPEVIAHVRVHSEQFLACFKFPCDIEKVSLVKVAGRLRFVLWAAGRINRGLACRVLQSNSAENVGDRKYM